MQSTVDYKFFEKHKYDNDRIFVTINNESKSIILRNRRDGDRIKLEFGTKKIKEILIEKKLDNESKNCVPLLIINDEIAACMPGFLFNLKNRISIDHLVGDDAKKILAIIKI